VSYGDTLVFLSGLSVFAVMVLLAIGWLQNRKDKNKPAASEQK